jgi:hypothetical protein
MRAVITIALLAAFAFSAQAGERKHSQRNYILRRQQVIPGLGTPSVRRIYGKRELDVYRDGSIYEKDNLVGVQRR